MSKNKGKSAEELLQEALVPVEEQPYPIPENWVWVRLGKVAQINPPKSKLSDISDDEICSFIPMTCLSDKLGTITEIEPRTYAEVKKGYTQFLEGDILFAKITPCMENGKSAIAKNLKNGFGYGSTEFFVIRTSKLIDNRYIHMMVRSVGFRAEAKGQMTGAVGQQRVPKTFLENYCIPLPPLEEQKRIADKVERLLNKINQAKQLIEEAKETFELRRAAILDKAFRGKLTAHLRENHISEKGSINIEKSHVSPFEIPDEWRWLKASDLFSSFPRNGYSPKSTGESSLVKTLKLGAITKGYFKKEEFKFIDEEIQPDSYLWLKNGDFLIQRANSIEYVGTAAIYTGPDDDCIYPDLIMKGKVDETIILPQYLVFWINSSFGKNYIRENATGTAGNMPKINQKVVKEFPVPLPSISEQKLILGTLEKIINNEKNIRQSIEEIEAKLNTMTDGILTKAFSGELGTTEIEDEHSIDLLKECLL